MAELAQPKKNNKDIKRDYIVAVGRRRSSVARVRLYQTVKDGLLFGALPVKKGEIMINEKPIAEYFPSEVERHLYTEPLRLTSTSGQYALTIKVAGGGRVGQLQAVVAAIAKALSLKDREKNRSILKKKGFLVRDSRIRQRRNVGTGGKSRRQKQSPKR